MKERKTMRLASLLLVCVLLCGMLATFASAAGAPRATYVLNVTTSAANVRREASTDAEVGTSCEVTSSKQVAIRMLHGTMVFRDQKQSTIRYLGSHSVM